MYKSISFLGNVQFLILEFDFGVKKTAKSFEILQNIFGNTLFYVFLCHFLKLFLAETFNNACTNSKKFEEWL